MGNPLTSWLSSTAAPSMGRCLICMDELFIRYEMAKMCRDDNVFDDLIEGSASVDMGETCQSFEHWGQVKLTLSVKDFIVSVHSTQLGCRVIACRERDIVSEPVKPSFQREFFFTETYLSHIQKTMRSYPLLADIQCITSQCQLACVIPSHTPNKNKFLSPGNDSAHIFEMDRVVFGHLFGSDLLLLEGAAVILALADGRVYAVPLIQGLASQTNSAAPCQLLYSLDQPVVNIHGVTSQLKEEGLTDIQNVSLKIRGVKGKHSLLLIGCLGKLVCITEDEHGMPVYRELSLYHPVVCSMILGRVLFHSTGKDVYRTDLTSLINKRSCDTRLNSIPLGFGRVTSFEAYDPKENENKDCSTHIIARTCTGSVLKIPVSPRQKVDRANSSAWSRGQQMKDLLTSIHSTAELLSQCQLSMADQDQLLSQLNLACVLSSQTRSSEKGDFSKSQCPVNCEVKFQRCDFTSSCDHEYTLLVSVENRSGLTMSPRWIVCVSISCGESSGGLERLKNFSECLGPLPSGQHRSYKFPITQECFNFLPLRVSVFLVLNARETENLNLMMGEGDTYHEDYKCDSTDCSDRMVCVPLQKYSFDIIHFLQPCTVGMSSLEKRRQNQNPMDSTLFSLAKRQDCVLSRALPNKLHEEEKDISVHLVQIKLIQNEESRKFLINNASCKGDSPEKVIMRHVLQDCDAFSNCDLKAVKAVCPFGHQVALNARVTSSEAIVSVQASDLHHLVSLTKAVRSRLKMIPHANVFELGDLQDALKDLNVMSEQILDIQDNVTSRKDDQVSTVKAVADMYLRLRHVPLLDK